MAEIMLDQFHSVNVSGRTGILTSNRRLLHHLTKQLNILMANPGVPSDRIPIDTTTGAVAPALSIRTPSWNGYSIYEYLMWLDGTQ